MKDWRLEIENLKFFFFILVLFPVFVHAKVVINEVQIEGATATDEFVELYNNGSEAVNLSGWRLSKKTASGNEYNLLTTFPSVTILPGSFFVIGHANFSGTKHAAYSTSQSLASDNSVILYQDAGDTVVDVVGYGTVTAKEGSACPNPLDGKSLGRLPDGVDTDNNLNDFVSNLPTAGRENASGGSSSQTSTPTPTNNQNSPSSNQSPPVPSGVAHIVVSEVLPNPVGSDTSGEWIELENNEAHEVNLVGWVLEDSSGHAFLISKSLPNTTIPAGGYYTLDYNQTKISLNNTSDTVILKRSDRSIADQISYTNVSEGQSYARFESGFKVTDMPTKNASNVFTVNNKQTTDNSKQMTNTNQRAVTSQQQTANNYQSNFLVTNPQAPTSTPPVSLKGKIRFSEIMPNPEGDDEEGEWIEVENISGELLKLEGLKLKDKAAENLLPVKDVAAGGFAVYQKPEFSLTLNNTSESLKLVDATGEVVDQVSYEDSEEGVSYSRFDATWKWTVPTKGAKNILKEQSTVNSQQQIQKTAKSSSSGGAVTVSGIILVRPHVFGKTILYISGDEGNYQIYFQKGNWPGVSDGQRVTVRGQTSTAGDVPRLKIQSPLQIEITSEESLLEPEEREVTDLSEDDIGGFYTVAGEMLESSGSSVVIGDHTGELEVYFKSKEVKKPAFEQGKPIQVTGILVKSNSGVRLLPRYPEDITFPASEILGASNSLPDKRSWGVWVMASFLVVMAFFGFVFRNKIRAQYQRWKESKHTIDDSFDE